MHHPRLVGGLISLAALPTLLLVLFTTLAAAPAVAAPSAARPPAPSSSAAAVPAAAQASAQAVPVWDRWARRQRQRRDRWVRDERAEVLRVARRLLGTPYVYGGTSPAGFDCSGFTRYVYAQLGIALEHGATDQSRVGRSVRLRDLVPGDLVFYGSPGAYYHVGVYAGGGRMIHAPHSGEVVRYDPLRDASAARRLILS